MGGRPWRGPLSGDGGPAHLARVCECVGGLQSQAVGEYLGAVLVSHPGNSGRGREEG